MKRGSFSKSTTLGLWAAMALALGACGSDKDGAEDIIDVGSGGSGSNDPDGGESGMGSGGESIFGNGDGGPIGVGNNDGGRECGRSVLEADKRKVNVLLVLDKSGSMTDQPSGFSESKWDALNGALTATLESAKADISFGLELFPFPNNPNEPIVEECEDNCCEMPTGLDMNVIIAAGETGVPKILSALEKTAPGGQTPTAAALARALDYFMDGAGADLDGDNFVLLATDGGPNCNTEISCNDDPNQCTKNLDGECPAEITDNCCAPNINDQCLDDDATVAQIQDLAKAKVGTFVVGIPGSESYEASLNRFAIAGGRPQSGATKYFAVNASGGAEGLASVLESITAGLIKSCRLQLQEKPPGSDALINVEIDGEFITKDGDDGWDLDRTTDPPTMVLKGETCEALETVGAKNVKIVFGCPTKIE